MPELVYRSPGPRTSVAPVLTIATATYRRVRELSALLDSLARQIPQGGRVEFVLCDNASGDATDAVARTFIEQNPELPVRFYAQHENVGVDRNILDVLGLGRGRYVWFLADDDEIAPGKLDEVLEFLAVETCDVAIVRCSAVAEWDLFPRQPGQGPRWVDPGDSRWAGLMCATPFLASMIFRAELLPARIAAARSLVGTCYAAWGISLGLLSSAERVPYFDDVCVLGNKNFNGVARFANFDVMVRGRIDTWDAAARGRVREVLRPGMEQLALAAWRSAAADTIRVGPRAKLLREYIALTTLLGPKMLRGAPWVLTAMAVPVHVRRGLDSVRQRLLGRDGGQSAATA